MDNPTKGLADNELKDKLKRRHHMSEGDHLVHCFVVPARRGDADSAEEHDGAKQDGEDRQPGMAHFSTEERIRELEALLAEAAAAAGAREDGERWGQRLREMQRLSKAGAAGGQPGTAAAARSAAADAAAGTTVPPSPCYEMSTPLASPSPSRATSPRPGQRVQTAADAVAPLPGRSPPRPAGAASRPAAIRSPVPEQQPAVESTAEEDKMEFEWQFEIMNSLPRDRAIALVNYLRRNEQERAKACSFSKQLQRTNSELERRLRTMLGGAKDRAPGRRRCCCTPCWWCCRLLGRGVCRLLSCALAAVALPALALAAVALATWAGIALPAPGELVGVAVTVYNDAVAGGSWPQVNAPTNIATWPEIYNGAGQVGYRGWEVLQDPRTWARIYYGAGKLGQRGFELLEQGATGVCARGGWLQSGGTMRETTVREMTLRETTTREYNPEEVERLKSEHEVMAGQLEKLHFDIDDAIHRGQEMVCWRV